MIVKRTETEITYPHLKAPIEKQKQEYKTEMFEELARDFHKNRFMAPKVIWENEAGCQGRCGNYQYLYDRADCNVKTFCRKSGVGTVMACAKWDIVIK